MIRAPIFARILAVGTLIVSGCFGFGSDDSTEPLPGEPCSPDAATAVRLGNFTWHVCTGDGPAAELRSHVQENLTRIDAEASDALKGFPFENASATIDAWDAYEALWSNELWPSLTRILDRIADANATVAGNQTFADIRERARTTGLAPLQVFKEATKDSIDAKAAALRNTRLAWSGWLVAGLVAGSIVGGAGAQFGMRRAERKAEYWGAFGRTTDVQEMVQLLLRVAMVVALLGALAAIWIVAWGLF